MAKRYACNRLYLTSDRYISPAVVTISNGGEVEGYSLLLEETSATEWIGGVIVMSDRADITSFSSFACFFKDMKKAKHPDYAWHISNFDFEKENFSSQSVIRRL